MEDITTADAIENSIRKWTVLAETGECQRWIKDITTNDMPHGCALCRLAGQSHCSVISRYRCRKYCPYAQRFRCCCNRGNPFRKWENISCGDDPKRIEFRKKYALEFLEQLKLLKAEAPTTK